MTRDFDAELAEMKRGFISRLPGKLDEIRTAAAARSLDDVRMLSHRMRGTCGSYGLTAVGKAAAAIEDRIDKAAGASSDALWTEIDHLLSVAHLAIQEAK
jgi:HPt (histidine-containing phosphotransfer) domain-containing protein